MTAININKIGSNMKQVEIARLRTTALNDAEAPVVRIQAARKLLQDYGPSARNLPIIRKIIKLFSSDPDANVAERALKLRARLAKILDLKAVKLPPEIDEQPIEIPEDATNTELIAFESESQERGVGRPRNSEDWSNEPPLPLEEQMRLVDCQRAYDTYINGMFVLKPGANAREMIETAIDGRPFTAQVLKRLHFHMAHSFLSGGVALASGPLYLELTRILRSQGVLPPEDPNQKTYGKKLWEELMARS